MIAKRTLSLFEHKLYKMKEGKERRDRIKEKQHQCFQEDTETMQEDDRNGRVYLFSWACSSAVQLAV